MAAVISSGCVSHSRVEPSTSANSSVTVPVGSPLTARSLHSVALMLTSMRPARSAKTSAYARISTTPRLRKYDLRPILWSPQHQIVERMTIDIALGTELPTIAYEHAQSPEEAHGLIRQARQQGPIAMGPHGPEVLSYDLVRTVMRDDRFAMPKGVSLAAQGITSGELWDISLKGLLSLDGAAHHRQRRLVSKAFTPRAAERLRTTCTDVIAELVDSHAPATGRCDVVADIARQYPIPIICAHARHTTGGLAPVLRLGR